MIPLTYPSRRPGKVSLALSDIRAGIAKHYVWGLLGWQDIRQRYRRSVIGPFWLTLSTGIMLGSMGLLYARLLRQGVSDYLPYLAVGLIVWGVLSTLVGECCTVFTIAEPIIKQVRLPLTTHVCRVVWRNVIIFAHNAVILIPIMIWAGHPITAAIATVPLGLMVLVVNGIWIGIVLGIICARFRDVPQIVTNLLQVAFFVTPILYRPNVLGNKIWVAQLNPFYHLIEVIRAPLLGSGVPVGSWLFLAVFTPLGFLVAVLLLARTRERVAYWL